MQLPYTRPHAPVDTITASKSTKTSGKITHFTIQFRSKNLILRTSAHLTLCPRNTIKNSFQFTNFLANTSVLSEKTFALHHVCISLHTAREDFRPRDSVFGWRREEGLRPNNFLKAVLCLGLVKCFTIFHFN